MDGTQNTIGLETLLDEVGKDLDELRRKHPNDYKLKDISMWWDLERERLLVRHVPSSVIRLKRRLASMKVLMAGFFVGWLTMIAVQTTVSLLFP
jgi:hypothetical protein